MPDTSKDLARERRELERRKKKLEERAESYRREQRTKYLEARRKSIANAIKELRTKSGFTQQEIATLLGCSRRRITRVEQGEVDLSLGEIEIISKQMEVPMESFIARPVGLDVEEALLPSRPRELKMF